MSPIVRELLKGLGEWAAERILKRIFGGKPAAPSAAEMDAALAVGGPTADAAARARAEVDEARLRSAAGRSMVHEDEAPSFGLRGEPERKDLN